MSVNRRFSVSTRPPQQDRGALQALNRCSVSAYDALEGDDVEVSLTGVYELPKIAGAIELGEPLYWNGAALTPTAGSGLPRVGTAAKAAANDDATVQVRLSGETA
jgi:predicted RecA/RadA family phage recombinase